MHDFCGVNFSHNADGELVHVRMVVLQCTEIAKLHVVTLVTTINMTIASYADLLTPVFVASSTDAGKGLLKLVTCSENGGVSGRRLQHIAWGKSRTCA